MVFSLITVINFSTFMVTICRAWNELSINFSTSSTVRRGFSVPITMSTKHKFIDIGANLADPMYKGFYNKGPLIHPADLDQVIARAFESYLSKIIITGTNLESSKKAIEIARTDDRLFATVGVHPTNCNDFLNEDFVKYTQSLKNLIKDNPDKVVAFGEFGLDYHRVEYCSKEDQLTFFQYQLEISREFDLPLFLHMRNSSEDFLEILGKRKDAMRGVVHSFDGTLEDMNRILDLGFYIGVNGCSLKTEENLSVVKKIPLDRLLIETDSPWCTIRTTSAANNFIKTTFPTVRRNRWDKHSMVRDRNEPCTIIQIYEVLTAIRDEDPDEIAKKINENSEKLFFSNLKNV